MLRDEESPGHTTLAPGLNEKDEEKDPVRLVTAKPAQTNQRAPTTSRDLANPPRLPIHPAQLILSVENVELLERRAIKSKGSRV